MLGIRYIKVFPTEYVIHYRGEVVRREGKGLAFFYYAPYSNISVVPTSTIDVPFIFNEITGDYQEITVQGQLTYRIIDPKKVASILNYTVDSNGYTSEDPEKLSQRLLNIAQVQTRQSVLEHHVQDVMKMSHELSQHVLGAIKQNPIIGELGLEVLTFAILAIKPTPEMSRAMETEARESLLKKADDAVYARRNSAVEQERKIKENELSTEVAVAEKRRQVQETEKNTEIAMAEKNRIIQNTQMDTRIQLAEKEQAVQKARMNGMIQVEQARKDLVKSKTENMQEEAKAQAFALRSSLEPFTELSPDVLQYLSTQNSDTGLMTAMAFKKIAENAGKIGQLNITPELFATLLQNRSNE